MDTVLNAFGGQLLALLTFFAFPAIQYILLKRVTSRAGGAELWYLPRFGFRLVIRNLPGRHTLSGIKYRALLRTIVPAGSTSGSATYRDNLLHQRDDFFVFPGVDQIVVAFRLEGTDINDLAFVATDVMGVERSRVPVASFDRLVCDYEATVENLLNFDVRLARRAELSSDSMRVAWAMIASRNEEQRLPLDVVRTVG